MDKLSNLHPAAGARRRTKRIGRGQGSGHGGTATRGHKGAGARAGNKHRPWFEGGQMPLVRRVPKFGFTSPFRIPYEIVNVATLETLAKAGRLAGGKVTPEGLFALGIVSRKAAPVKILGDGSLTAALEVAAHAFSKSAVQKIEAAGGKALTVPPTTAK